MADVIQLHPVLTIKAMDEASWEPALSYALPENPDIEFLNRARTEVLIYLDFVTSDAAQFEDVTAEINRAAARLIEIAEHWPATLEGDVTARLEAERTDRESEWRKWLASRPFAPRLVPSDSK
jgi:hypothetical protein